MYSKIILAPREEVYNTNRRLPFSFSKMQKDEIIRDTLKFETSKACQGTCIATKTVKENVHIFANGFKF